MTLTLTDLQYRILELIVENVDAGLKRFNRADVLSDELGATITEVQTALKDLEIKRYIERAGGEKTYSPTQKGRDEI